MMEYLCLGLEVKKDQKYDGVSRSRFRNMHEKDQKYVKVSLSRFRNMFEKD